MYVLLVIGSLVSAPLPEQLTQAKEDLIKAEHEVRQFEIMCKQQRVRADAHAAEIAAQLETEEENCLRQRVKDGIKIKALEATLKTARDPDKAPESAEIRNIQEAAKAREGKLLAIRIAAMEATDACRLLQRRYDIERRPFYRQLEIAETRFRIANGLSGYKESYDWRLKDVEKQMEALAQEIVELRREVKQLKKEK